MPNIEEYTRRIMQAKAFIDNGFCRVGPGLRPERKIETLLIGGASRCLALADSVVELCRHEHPNEALPLLRQLAETVVALRWCVRAKDPEGRAAQILDERAGVSWDSMWNEHRLLERAKPAGVPAEDLEFVLAGAPDFLTANSVGAPWSHLFAENQKRGPEAGLVLKTAACLMGHALSALDSKWPQFFPGAEAMWD